MISIRKVTIIGANGTMGRNVAAIFAAFGNAEVYLVSRSMEKSISAKEKAYQSVRAESIKERMIPTDYEALETCIYDSDLIFEACAEEWDVKRDIHEKIASIMAQMSYEAVTGKVVGSGTSGLSITRIAELYPENLRHQIMGIHFFNPPYQMTLCEMTPTRYVESKPGKFDEISQYMQEVLRRTVVRTTDAPAFLGNRIGFYFINSALQAAEKYRYQGGIDYIDAILGPFTGRSMPPLVTANFVGLDVHKAIVDNLYTNTNDYANEAFVLPAFTEELIQKGKCGRKAGAGLYKTVVLENGVKLHQIYDVERGMYREQMQYRFPFVEEMLKSLKVGDYADAMKTLVNNQSQEASLCCKFLLEYIVYALHISEELGCLRDAADDVMATGFHWCPPLALAEAFSAVVDILELCRERLAPDILAAIDLDRLFTDSQPSKYDYRKYILAKR